MSKNINVIEPIKDSVVLSTAKNKVPITVNATHKGVMHIGGIDLECYVLEDGRRVFNKKGMAKAIGLKSDGGNSFMRTIGRKGLGSEIDDRLQNSIENPILLNYLRSDPNHAYEADVLVEVCKAIKRAHDAGKLTSTQKDLYYQSVAILNAFAKIGVVALIDEATGYQTERSPDALRLLVQQYLEEEKREWQKEFPDEFYRELNRIYGSQSTATRKSGAIVINKPQHFAKFTRSYVYEPLENGAVLEELDKLNPKIDDKGNRKNRFHQHMTEEYGVEKLRLQMREVLTLLKISDTITEFKRMFKKRFPQSGDQMDLL
ncbi:P63C domain-containing protein [Psychrobacter nivimaris]|uniref:P63C domain-containing protein n=1 Tax=Psychrobacter nivimaris TaxID=281738 RepID=UPI0037351AF5